jgi:hypothetical protein
VLRADEIDVAPGDVDIRNPIDPLLGVNDVRPAQNELTGSEIRARLLNRRLLCSAQ